MFTLQPNELFRQLNYFSAVWLVSGRQIHALHPQITSHWYSKANKHKFARARTQTHTPEQHGRSTFSPENVIARSLSSMWVKMHTERTTERLELPMRTESNRHHALLIICGGVRLVPVSQLPLVRVSVLVRVQTSQTRECILSGYYATTPISPTIECHILCCRLFVRNGYFPLRTHAGRHSLQLLVARHANKLRG